MKEVFKFILLVIGLIILIPLLLVLVPLVVAFVEVIVGLGGWFILSVFFIVCFIILFINLIKG